MNITKVICILFFLTAFVHGNTQIISTTKTNFDLAGAYIFVDPNDYSLVKKSAELLQKDIENVSGKKLPVITASLGDVKGNAIIIGSLERSSLIKQLVQQKKITSSKINGKWEAFQIQSVQSLNEKIPNALVILGNDRRGTAFGVFELSKQMGVSPWWWWADVPVKKKNQIYVQANAFLFDAPKVKYRGIFINDEAPALSGWTYEKFGGFNHRLYENVFELMLRLKANYLWPAMWGNAFYDDDSLNKQIADDYGIVIGTSHHEPLMRAHDEWRRYGKGKWNYEENKDILQQFWKGGMERATNEKIVSVGMRGDGDEPMTEGTAIALLENIVKDQRQIIENVTGKPASETPQLWALYKEVQDYYDKGMRVPDDITLLIADDNWGNIRKLPTLSEKPRKGGYGIYYHFDYVGGPRNYKWLNTNNIARVWEQMHLAWQYKAREIWIVNVGDIKPMEFPISFFLDYAWDPEKWNEDNLRTYYTRWASEQFGANHSKEIGNIIRKYSQYSARRKPELIDENTYSLTAYNEAERVTQEWKELLQDAEKVNWKLPSEYHDAYFQLVLHPIKALANLHEMYYAVAKNRQAASQNLLEANYYAFKAKHLFERDSLITLKYHTISNGKWNHMMSQTHIGYTYWQQPPFNKMPEVKYVSTPTNRTTNLSVDTITQSARSLIPANTKTNVFYENDRVVSIEAQNWTKAGNTQNIKWKVIQDIGRTGSGITTFPVTSSTQLSSNIPHVEYDFYTTTTGKVKLHLYFSPTLNFHNNNEGLQFAVSIDNEKPQLISLNKNDKDVATWESWVANNIIIKSSEHALNKQGKHTIKYWMISPGVVLQKLVVDLGGLKESYLGPPETKF